MLVTVPLQEKSVSQSQYPTSGTWPVTSDTDTIDTDTVTATVSAQDQMMSAESLLYLTLTVTPLA